MDGSLSRVPCTRAHGTAREFPRRHTLSSSATKFVPSIHEESFNLRLPRVRYWSSGHVHKGTAEGIETTP